MKLIQTAWLSGNGQHLQSGGWINERYHLMSCALSCLQLKEMHPELALCLHTDNKGKQILIDELQLPYDQVDTSLGDIKLPFPEFMWVLKKIVSYTLSSVDFLHIDSDVFIFDKLPSTVLESKLVVQNEEILAVNNTLYDETLSIIKKQFCYQPAYLEIASYKPGDTIRSINAGLIGGNHRFFKDYAKEVFSFLTSNRINLKHLNKNCNTFIEQYIFKKYAEITNTSFDVLDSLTTTGDYDGYADFHKVLLGRNYLHIMGEYKSKYWINNQVDLFLKIYHPKIHKSIVNYTLSHKYFTYNGLETVERNQVIIKKANNNPVNDQAYTLFTDFFSRSLFFLKEYIAEVDSHLNEPLFLKKYLKSRIRGIQNKPLRDRLLDLYKYEKKIWGYVYTISQLTNHDHGEPLSKEKFDCILTSSCKISWNTTIPVIKSKWNWSDTTINNMIESVSNICFEQNFNQSASTFYVVLYLDFINKKIFEYKLDVVSSCLVELLKWPTTIHTILEYFIDQYNECSETEKALIKDVVLAKLSFFYLSNFIKVHQ